MSCNNHDAETELQTLREAIQAAADYQIIADRRIRELEGQLNKAMAIIEANNEYRRMAEAIINKLTRHGEQ